MRIISGRETWEIKLLNMKLGKHGRQIRESEWGNVNVEYGRENQERLGTKNPA